jgi:pimeloyl-ACP methyl ester carboxylesterase
LIINHSINAGTILPYLRKAKDNGFEVIVTNTNDNLRDGKRIEGSGSPEEHAKTVWEQIKIINPASIAIVAHSYGGIVTSELARKYNEHFEKKVFAVAFTDSVHGSRGLTSRIIDIGINFVASSDKLGTEQHNYEGDIKRVSAGHSKHEWTSYSCIEALFEFLQEKYKIFNDLKDNSAANKKQKTEEL